MMILNQAILALQFSLFLPTHLVPSLTSTKRANLTSRQTQNCLEQDHKRLSIALIGCDSQFQSNSYFSLYFLPFLHSILTSLFSVSLFSGQSSQILGFKNTFALLLPSSVSLFPCLEFSHTTSCLQILLSLFFSLYILLKISCTQNLLLVL